MLGHHEIDGVLGGDLLQKLKVTVDYRKKEVRWQVRRQKTEDSSQ
jgi:hypothetical protein